MKYLPYIVLILLTGMVLVFNAPIFETKGSLLGSVNQFLQSALGGSSLQERLTQLELENEDLRSQILSLRVNQGADYESLDYQIVKIYSDYPFNNKSLLLIAGGADKGFKPGMPVTAGDSLLVGRIKEVFQTSSAVSTVFDSSLELPVRIGFKEIDALFTGGSEPALSLIAREAGVEAGEVVFTASAGFPYGLEVGRVEKIGETKRSPFKEGVLRPAYNLSELREVSVITNYGTDR